TVVSCQVGVSCRGRVVYLLRLQLDHVDPRAAAHSQSHAAAPAESVGDRNDRNNKRQNIIIMKRSKPSGATGRKRKKEQEETGAKYR
ncbi:hypothetical protein NQZ68_017007, partial [Dissostichus eleginoides]